ncbi:retropepsin-like aspartic protease [Methylocaldum sp.]|uniref:retropepsin-like aspartic protease family protein n=1 Tax=Methylocaldum sp. TaxID=1969727 RepID=UPI002D60139B|nr:retropepsin-like aspartic protease [Methylocaldum sp.]HYE35103.1 retropepsin-like aspartic protease [Methylocaldum sp.]
MGLYDRDGYREEVRKKQEAQFNEQRERDAYRFRETESRPSWQKRRSPIVTYGSWILVVLVFTKVFDRTHDRRQKEPLAKSEEIVMQQADSRNAQVAVQPRIHVQPQLLTPPPQSYAPDPSVQGVPGNSPKILELVLPSGSSGNFFVRGQINQHDVVFEVDTGASLVVIPERLKWQLKLTAAQPIQASTANGVVTNYMTHINNLSLGPIRLRNIAGALNSYAPNDVVLLGMSALQRLRLIHQNGRLVIQQLVNPDEDEPEEGDAEPINKPLALKRSVKECMGSGKVVDAKALRCMQGD